MCLVLEHGPAEESKDQVNSRESKVRARGGCCLCEAFAQTFEKHSPGIPGWQCGVLDTGCTSQPPTHFCRSYILGPSNGMHTAVRSACFGLRIIFERVCPLLPASVACHRSPHGIADRKPTKQIFTKTKMTSWKTMTTNAVQGTQARRAW